MIRPAFPALAALLAALVAPGCALSPAPQSLSSSPEPPASPDAEAPIEADWEDYHASQAYYREGVFEISIPPGEEREFLVLIDEGETIVYRWDVSRGSADGLNAEFRGLPGAGPARSYARLAAASDSGRLTAPFSGSHGWSLANGGRETIVVLLRIAGFYEEID